MPDPTPEELKAAADKAASDKAAADAKAAAAVQAEEAKSHVRMTHKDHGKLSVHPTTVGAHKAAGWVVAK